MSTLEAGTAPSALPQPDSSDRTHTAKKLMNRRTAFKAAALGISAIGIGTAYQYNDAQQELLGRSVEIGRTMLTPEEWKTREGMGGLAALYDQGMITMDVAVYGDEPNILLPTVYVTPLADPSQVAATIARAGQSSFIDFQTVDLSASQKPVQSPYDSQLGQTSCKSLILAQQSVVDKWDVPVKSEAMMIVLGEVTHISPQEVAAYVLEHCDGSKRLDISVPYSPEYAAHAELRLFSHEMEKLGFRSLSGDAIMEYPNSNRMMMSFVIPDKKRPEQLVRVG